MTRILHVAASPKGTAAEGDGVAPDVRVELSRADFVAGKDPVLEAAIELLTQD